MENILGNKKIMMHGRIWKGKIGIALNLETNNVCVVLTGDGLMIWGNVHKINSWVWEPNALKDSCLVQEEMMEVVRAK